VPVYNALASQFLICQRWFAAHPGPTFCNRFYTVTGRLNGRPGNWELDNFHGDAFKPVATRTLFDHLTEHGVSWRYYEHRYCFLRLFERYTFDHTFVVEADDPARGFFAGKRLESRWKIRKNSG
jgi:phospholipase C